MEESAKGRFQIDYGGEVMEPIYLSIEPEKTGKKIKKLLDASGYTVRDVQRLMGFNNPQAIYDYSVAPEAPVRQTGKQCSESRAAPKSSLSVHLGILAFASRPCRY